MKLLFAERLKIMHFDRTIFHSLQFAPAFLRKRMVVQEKAIKSLSVSLPTNAVALTLENIKESKKQNVLILGFEPGTLRLQYWTRQLSDHHDYGS